MFFVKKGVAARLREVGYDYDRAKVRWRQYCEVVSKVPIYFKAWYWDATCDATDDWWVVILEDSVGEIEAAFPFVYQKRKGLYFIETPWQVAAAGIWINKTDVSLGELTKYTEEVLNTLPKYDRFSMIFSSKYWTWQPFYWQGFQSAPYYTMCVKANSPEDVLPSISKDRRKRVNRGKKKYRIETDRITFQQYWEFLISSYEDRERNLQYEKKKFYKLYTALVDHNACHIRAVYDGDNIVAVNIMLVDDGKYYHQFGTQMKNADPNATSYAIYDAISGAIAEGKVFDFEGSMIQGVCEFNSSFHPVWETEYRIENYSSRYIIIDSLRRIAVVIKNSIAKQLRGGYNYKAAKEKWREFCEVEKSIPLYFKAWYWDATCDDVDDWWVVLIEDDAGEIEAALPFEYRHRKGMYFIEQPWQVAASGIWIRTSYPDNVLKGIQYLDWIVGCVMELLPMYDRFSLIFDSRNLWTWHPFYWRGFSCTPTYTMVIPSLERGNEKNYFSKRKRQELNKTERLVSVSFADTSLEDYWRLFIVSYEERGRIPEYTKERFFKLVNAAIEHDAAWICGVYDGDKLIAGNICLTDENCAYNQFGCFDPKTKIKAESYAIFSSISRAAHEGKRFDFEGSMIHGVAEFNCGFNPILETQYRIEKYSNKYIAADSLRRIKNGMLGVYR